MPPAAAKTPGLLLSSELMLIYLVFVFWEGEWEKAQRPAIHEHSAASRTRGDLEGDYAND